MYRRVVCSDIYSTGATVGTLRRTLRIHSILLHVLTCALHIVWNLAKSMFGSACSQL